MSAVLAGAPPMLAFDAEVRAVTRLSPTFLRLTLGGPSLDRFHRCGPLGPRDLRIKLILPPGGALTQPFGVGEGWYQRWLARPATERGTMRTYTIRAIRDDDGLGGGAYLGRDDGAGDGRNHDGLGGGTYLGRNHDGLGGGTDLGRNHDGRGGTLVDVDIVMHGEDDPDHLGPGAAWAAAAQVGDRLTVLGPNADGPDYGGIAWAPPPANPAAPVRILLAGDETAVPAMCSILDTLPTGYAGHALLEVPTAPDVLPCVAPPGMEVRWLPRGERPRGAALLEAVQEVTAAGPPTGGAAVEDDLPEVDLDDLWEEPDPDGASAEPAAAAAHRYAWVAAEAGVVRDVRRHLVREVGVPRERVAFMGYWREGRSHAD